jgi:acetylglutamate kinase
MAGARKGESKARPQSSRAGVSAIPAGAAAALARPAEEAGAGANGALAGAQGKARLLAEALPYMLRYEGRTVVVKYGGHAMGDPELARAFAQDIVMLKLAGVNPVVVHGGGPQIGAMLERLQIKSEFRAGLRVTDKPTVEVVEMVLAGAINKAVVSAINLEGGKAVGICGKDANLCVAKKLEKREADPNSNIERVVDLGYVGEPEEINPHIIEVITNSDLIPVVAPVAVSRAGDTLNINADTFATALAVAVKAERLLMLTDVPGVLDRDGRLIPSLSIAKARRMIADGTISGGMIPKVEGCFEVVEAGVAGVVIMNGKVPHAVLLELFTEHGAGTLVTG